MKQINYPFSAIVGQEKLKKALLLCAVNPAIGGLLIKGDKGTAKSTACRALASVAPLILKAKDCRFNCSPDQVSNFCEVCSNQPLEYIEIPVPFVNLPLGASEERVLGSLDLDGLLTEKKKKLQPGLLAAAHQGILYIDEVNLLQDHLVDVLLDVAAMGVNTIERDGFSISHPSRFTLIGTMNVEEGDLRPQFMDRFGLMVEVEAPRIIEERSEVVRRRMAFESSPKGFVADWEQEQQTLSQKLLEAKALLPQVMVSDDMLKLISQCCIEMEVKSLRGDIVMYKTACTIAALDQRAEVLTKDVKEAAELVLSHRSRNQQYQQPGGSKDKLDQIFDNSADKAPNWERPENNFSAEEEETQYQQKPEEQTGLQEIYGATKTEPLLVPNFMMSELLERKERGRSSKSIGTSTGKTIKNVLHNGSSELDIQATVLHALQRDSANLDIRKEDLTGKIKAAKTGKLILFVVDASGSMAASSRMEAVKGTVLALLSEAYQRRDLVGVIAFRGIDASIILPPTHSVDQASQAMMKLPTGGRTPLAHALQKSRELIQKSDPNNELQTMLILLSDGKANVSLSGTGDPWAETLAQATQIKNKNIPSIVINSEADFMKINKAEELARVLGAEYMTLKELTSAQLTPVVCSVI